MSDTTLSSVNLGSRAVLRRVEAGNLAICSVCGEQVKFAAKQNRQQVIANVYVDAKWHRVEHFHAECYEFAGTPFGPAEDQVLPRRTAAR
jgi:hypothetical protein